jgi:hypothetical protein
MQDHECNTCKLLFINISHYNNINISSPKFIHSSIKKYCFQVTNKIVRQVQLLLGRLWLEQVTTRVYVPENKT